MAEDDSIIEMLPQFQEDNIINEDEIEQDTENENDTLTRTFVPYLSTKQREMSKSTIHLNVCKAKTRI